MALVAAPARAADVTQTTVRQAAERWLTLKGGAYAAAAAAPVIKADPLAILDDDRSILAWHVPLAPCGYLILQPDDRLNPVRAFSMEGDLNLEDTPANALRALLWRDQRNARELILALDAGKTYVSADTADLMTANQAAWNELLTPGPAPAALGTPTNILVAPLLNTTWSQWNHYNDNCPPASPALSGYDNRCPVGCIAVVGAQVMKYYAWPPFGEGTHSYTDAVLSVTGVFSTVFATNYDWAAMLTNYAAFSSYDPTSTLAVAQIMYDVGVAVNMNYGTNSASASLPQLHSAFSLYFHTRSGDYLETNSASFLPRLRQEILTRRPAPVSIPGHAVVADGLSSDSSSNTIHINYGWGISTNNGWYLVSDVNGKSLEDGIFGVEPRAEPVLFDYLIATNLTGIVTPSWSYPDWHTGKVTRFRLEQGTLVVTNLTNTCTSFGEWALRGDPWVISNSIGACVGDGYCKGDNNEEGWILLPPIRTLTNSSLGFRFSDYTYSAWLEAQLSTNQGLSWITLFRYRTNSITALTTNLSLAGWTNSDCRLRLGYAEGGSTHYIGTYATLDNITLSNIATVAWSPVATNIPATARSFTLTNTVDGLTYYRVQADTGGAWVASSTFAPAYSDLAGDVDGDQLPNGWEFRWTGTPTNMTATADSDTDGLSNLEEYRCGTCPTNAASVLALTAIAVTNNVGLAWQSVSGHWYSVWRSTNLMNPAGFVAIVTGVTGSAGSLVHADTNVPSGVPVFYRITAE